MNATQIERGMVLKYARTGKTYIASRAPHEATDGTMRVTAWLIKDGKRTNFASHLLLADVEVITEAGA